VVFARGALEVPPIGLVAGPPLQAALLARLVPLGKTLSFTGVNYIASFAGLITGGSATGAAAMAAQLTDIANSCPSASLVTAGYDEGGQLVHDSAKLLTAPVAARLKAAVIFGDPDNGDAVQGVSPANTDEICHFGDLICSTTFRAFLVLPPHLTYGIDAGAAANFIVARV
ncbi:cutinase, partial [Mycena albidolilacea]